MSIAGDSEALLPPQSTPDTPPDDTQPIDVQVLRPYGVSIDTHSKFIQVCVMYQHKQPDGGATVRRHEKEFPTHWYSLVAAKRRVLDMLGPLAQADTLRYFIESTGTYHFPVLKAWGGMPAVVNPLLAGASHRKTDVLDARTLALKARGRNPRAVNPLGAPPSGPLRPTARVSDFAAGPPTTPL